VAEGLNPPPKATVTNSRELDPGARFFAVGKVDKLLRYQLSDRFGAA
jgi:hypothetical protein